ncbi:cytidylyltransferase domain-containing protein [Salinibacter ruber]|uniref:N-acylneuraminate cytidylyltransferase n=1 Tax=Salinibacter ruber TaxID=146919 RepID=A0A9X3A9A5_9BACT|nr:acylneuraminate cytidylyltransferase family protein [Salinibacter ruber]MCS4122743.1 N-acylneuraminate cytidylyltransferase [Salinibacter ruber]
MIEGQSILGVILARGGSKGLPRKNVCELAGKPLIGWTIEAGQKSEHLDRLILSSDDEEIMNVSAEYGCDVPFQRPSELAEDDTSSMAALLHAIDQVEPYEYVVLLQPTSPLRRANDIDATIKRCHENNAPVCVTVTKTDKPPQWMYTFGSDGRLEPVLDEPKTVKRRQEAPDTYVVNGAVYVARSGWLRRHETFYTDQTIGYPMPRERSADVDTALDLKWCEILLEK